MPLIDYENLFRPIEPPRQLQTANPAKDTLLYEIRRAAALLEAIALMIDAAPFHDFEHLDQEFAGALQAAGVALQCFRETRDCQGGA